MRLKIIQVIMYLWKLLLSPFQNNVRTSTFLLRTLHDRKCLERNRSKMAALKLQKLKELIRKSYTAGYNGCLELIDQYVEEAMIEIQNEIASVKEGVVGEWKIFTVEELKKKAIGTVFEHSRLGPGCIDGNSEKDKYMLFQNGEHGYFMQNVEPWCEPMRILQN